MRPGGPVGTCCGFSCWRVFSNGPSGLGLRRFFIIHNFSEFIIPIKIPSEEAIAETEIHPVTPEAKKKKVLNII